MSAQKRKFKLNGTVKMKATAIVHGHMGGVSQPGCP